MADSPQGGTEKTVTDHKKNSTEHFHYMTSEVHSQCSPFSINVPYTCTCTYKYIVFTCIYVHCMYMYMHTCTVYVHMSTVESL